MYAAQWRVVYGTGRWSLTAAQSLRLRLSGKPRPSFSFSFSFSGGGGGGGGGAVPPTTSSRRAVPGASSLLRLTVTGDSAGAGCVCVPSCLSVLVAGGPHVAAAPPPARVAAAAQLECLQPTVHAATVNAAITPIADDAVHRSKLSCHEIQVAAAGRAALGGGGADRLAVQRGQRRQPDLKHK